MAATETDRREDPKETPARRRKSGPASSVSSPSKQARGRVLGSGSSASSSSRGVVRLNSAPLCHSGLVNGPSRSDRAAAGRKTMPSTVTGPGRPTTASTLRAGTRAAQVTAPSSRAVASSAGPSIRQDDGYRTPTLGGAVGSTAERPATPTQSRGASPTPRTPGPSRQATSQTPRPANRVPAFGSSQISPRGTPRSCSRSGAAVREASASRASPSRRAPSAVPAGASTPPCSSRHFSPAPRSRGAVIVGNGPTASSAQPRKESRQRGVVRSAAPSCVTTNLVRRQNVSAKSRPASPRGNVAWRIMPPSSSVVASSSDGIRTPAAGPIVRQSASSAIRQPHSHNSSPAASPSTRSRTLQSGHAYASSWQPHPVRTTAMQVTPSSSLARAEPRAFLCEEQRVATEDPLPVASQAFIDPLSDSWNAAQELQEAAQHLGIGEETEEHKWFFEGLRRGFEKKARMQEQAAQRHEQRIAEESNIAATEAAALARCREELQQMQACEQRVAQEAASEALVASQAQTEEKLSLMTAEMTEVARANQRTSQEMAELKDSLSKECQRMAEQINEDPEHALFKDVRLPLYSEDHLRCMSPRGLRDHARHVRFTLGTLVSDLPEASSEIVEWVLDAQHEHLEILPELEKLLAASGEQFDPKYSCLNGNGDDKAVVLLSPGAAQRQAMNHFTSGGSPPAQMLHGNGDSIVASPLAVPNRSWMSSPQPSISPGSAAAISVAGSARKIADNEIRTLTPAVGLNLVDRLGPVRLGQGISDG